MLKFRKFQNELPLCGMCVCAYVCFIVHSAVADPEFPRGEGAKISRKLHEIKRIWTPGYGGGGGVRDSRNPPLRSANALPISMHCNCLDEA